MTVTIIIAFSLLLLMAYVFDITASKTKIPSVILLLLLGFGVKLMSANLNFEVPNLDSFLPILGTVGLILIVLEGSLELEINKSKLPLIFKSTVIALIPLLILSVSIAYYLYYTFNIPLKTALSNTIPIGIISSAIAIPSAKNLKSHEREFVTYESSLSDIFGVIFFNFITLNDNIGSQSVGHFAVEMIVMLMISFVATLLLAGLLNEIKHHVKFVPIIILVLLIYALSKVFHLPALIFIMIFGLFMGNLEELRHFKFTRKFHPINFSKDVHKFKEITSELAFLIRALFFMLFGFLIEVSDVLNSTTIIFAACVTFSIYLIRIVILKVFKLPFNPLVFIAPRGLITILLFLSIPMTQQIEQIDKSLITQIIILSAIVMMFGLIQLKKPEAEIAENN
ncbi:MAG: cation:proton antiporter [Ignavibacteria bacterium]|nr:cation:proton antiporter [Ignavibacteria bacterium]